MNPAMGFPMEMDNFPNKKTWVVSHKPVAVAAGLGMMGIHRNVIHQRFGNFILLGTILVDAEVSAYGQPINYNPCLECKLCVAACPDLHVIADSKTWIGFLKKERNIVWALVRRKIRLRGPLKLLVAFGKCFPQ